jgi:signal transduction histidine kinase/DNA-binding response OmpR family regulator
MQNSERGVVMMILNRKKKEQNEKYPSPDGVSGYEHILLYAIIFVIITLSNVTAPCFAADNSTAWTKGELAFMDAHPVIRLGVDPGFVPFEFIDDNGEYKGITADYLALVSKKTGLKFEVVKGLTWPEAYDMALAGDVDALPAVGKTDEREKHFIFSKPYYYFKRVIVTRDTDTSISGMEDLDGLTVAVQRNSSHHSYLLSYPNINLSLYNSVEAALTAVATGKEKAFIGNLATTNYIIRSNGLTNLRFVSFESEKPQALYFAVRKDWPVLISIFDKAMDGITDSEKLAINNKWIDLDTEIDYSPIIRILIIIGGFIAAVMGVSFFWIARLKKEIRQRKQIQHDLEKAKQEADEANEFKSSFMARMSHEIRTPLNAITGMAYLLKKTNLTLTQKMYADRITQASSNMLSIINDILDYSKIEAGKVELDTVSFSMDQVIQDVVNIVSYKIEEQEIGFKLSKDPLVPNWFFGDSKRIEQILLNVLNNAAKFTSRGEVSLDIRLIAKENGKYHLSFAIKDTGIGMDEEQVKKLFVPFTQGDSSINRRFGGSGLGLSIVKNLLDMMGGQIQVFSTAGEGTTFIIHLSLNIDKEKEDVYIKSLSGDHFKNVRTLVLERTGANMNLIESYLSAFGMHCELTTSQASALGMLEAADGKFAKPFDLFIVDYETPAEGGFEFVEAIRNNRKIANKPKFIMLLPMMREDLFDKLNDHGIDIGIGKPIIPSILFNGILDIFKLKAVSATQPSEKEKAGFVSLDRPYNILVVEDNKTNQLIAKSLLQQIGIESILASDGNEAVELYGRYKEKIALILMDLNMPGMDGYEAAEEIRKISSDIPIVAMTADVILGVKEKCAQSGIYHYISKPFDPDQFLQTIREIISENRHEVIPEPEILDKIAGLKNIGGDVDIYRQVLTEYYNENQDTPDKLSHAIDEKLYADAAQIVHKVKSSSGSIGARSLYELSIKLQKALDAKKADEIDLLRKDFNRKLRKLLAEISESED